MNKEDIIQRASRFVESSKYNGVTEEIALSRELIGMKIFEAPIFAFGAAEDSLFRELKAPSVIGEHFRLPKEWLPQAKTVISFFLPFTERVRRANREDLSWPSDEWLHGRIEGQVFVSQLCQYLKSELIQAGYDSVVPALDERFWSKTGFSGGSSSMDKDPAAAISYTSNWSERHAAYICGLGTFGLSKGLITEKGMAGRLGSIITALPLAPDIRKYKDIYEYCSMCGACARNCPVGAISLEKGKNHQICSTFLDKTAEKHKPRYGCGKCQVQVPCEGCIPKKTSL